MSRFLAKIKYSYFNFIYCVILRWENAIWQDKISRVSYLRFKSVAMNTAELKTKILKQIDALESDKLEGFYGLLLNYVNAQRSEEEWDLLSDEQRLGILAAKAEVESGQKIPHAEVTAKHGSRFGNA
ncbi:MAG: hypothetical protein C0424_03280 [Sphingobacteriaceae bacterium]|nr:hypothetical protein [Sphingobacteriaceae bacterium]